MTSTIDLDNGDSPASGLGTRRAFCGQVAGVAGVATALGLARVEAIGAGERMAAEPGSVPAGQDWSPEEMCGAWPPYACPIPHAQAVPEASLVCADGLDALDGPIFS